MAEGIKIVTDNRKAWHDYFIEDTFEAGIVLKGTEVKSLREGKANLKDSYVLVKDGEVFLLGCHISPYSHGNIENHDPERTRKLLLKKQEINKILGKALQKGYTIVPTKIYFAHGLAKVEVALAKGKQLHDKRDAIKEKEAKREIHREIKERSKI
ncbi:MAG: SsrA-binding protein SmpB [Nitrospirota bacterium]|nr:SsrA-binding protein SmpB [Nitrospirota bacterium]